MQLVNGGLQLHERTNTPPAHTQQTRSLQESSAQLELQSASLSYSPEAQDTDVQTYTVPAELHQDGMFSGIPPLQPTPEGGAPESLQWSLLVQQCHLPLGFWQHFDHAPPSVVPALEQQEEPLHPAPVSHSQPPRPQLSPPHGRSIEIASICPSQQMCVFGLKHPAGSQHCSPAVGQTGC